MCSNSPSINSHQEAQRAEDNTCTDSGMCYRAGALSLESESFLMISGLLELCSGERCYYISHEYVQCFTKGNHYLHIPSLAANLPLSPEGYAVSIFPRLFLA